MDYRLALTAFIAACLAQGLSACGSPVSLDDLKSAQFGLPPEFDTYWNTLAEENEPTSLREEGSEELRILDRRLLEEWGKKKKKKPKWYTFLEKVIGDKITFYGTKDHFFILVLTEFFNLDEDENKNLKKHFVRKYQKGARGTKKTFTWIGGYHQYNPKVQVYVLEDDHETIVANHSRTRPREQTEEDGSRTVKRRRINSPGPPSPRADLSGTVASSTPDSQTGPQENLTTEEIPILQVELIRVHLQHYLPEENLTWLTAPQLIDRVIRVFDDHARDRRAVAERAQVSRSSLGSDHRLQDDAMELGSAAVPKVGAQDIQEPFGFLDEQLFGSDIDESFSPLFNTSPYDPGS